MSPYIRFCSRQLNAAALIQHLHENSVDFRQLLKKCQTHSDVKGMPLTSYLLKPMQRITKYPLLIKKVHGAIWLVGLKHWCSVVKMFLDFVEH